MSFGFGGAQAQGAGAGNARADADLEEVQTEQLGFQSAAGNDKLRLLPTPWATDAQPPATASLLSVASGKGLVAAAGPDTLVIASTERVRETFANGAADNNIKSFSPQATISIPRVNQLAFSSDESCLVIAAEQGGGLAVYDTNALVNGGNEPAFQISTNGVSVRQLVPNPNPSPDLAHFFGIVLDKGQLLLADLKTRQLVNNSGGNAVFHENVTCACWSRLGKQMVAGRNDGTAVQIDPQGNVKAEIPRPPQLSNLADSRALSYPLTSIYWLETHEFLVVHSPENPPKTGDDDGMEMPPGDDSFYHLARRDKATNSWSFQTIVDPTPAFIQDGRVPARHFIQRLKDWPPNLDDTLVVLSTVSTETGVLTKSKSPLNPQHAITNVFTTTVPMDVRRAGLPLSVTDQMSDTSAIGMALDLSAKEKISQPIPGDDVIDTSPVPLPALYVLNNEGILSMWWLVYNESLRSNVAYPDLISAGGPRPLDAKASTPAPPSSFGSSMPPASPAQPSQSGGSAAFGGASQLGSRSSPWGAPPAAPAATPSAKPSQPAFGSSTPMGGGGSNAFGGTPASSTPAFGKPSAPAGGSGFGQVGGMGSKQSPWGSSQAPAATPAPSSGVFGGNASQQSPFSSFGQGQKSEPAASPFSTFGGASKPAASPFATVNSTENKASPSPFGAAASTENKPAASPFGAVASSENKPATSLFGASSTENKPAKSPFGASSSENKPATSPFAAMSKPSGSLFGSTENKPATSPFAAVSSTEEKPNTFSFGKPSLPNQPSGTTASFGTASSMGSGSTLSGNGFSSFGKPSAPVSREDTMGEEKKEGGLFGGFKLNSTFKGDGTAKDDLPKPKDPGAGLFGSNFGQALGETQKAAEPVTPVKKEPGTEDEPKLSDIPAASTTPGAPTPAKADDPLNYKAKRFFGDVPPSDVPAPAEKPEEKTEDPLNYKAKRFFGDVPPMDVPAPAEKPKEEDPLNYKAKRFMGDVPPSDVPAAAEPPTEQPSRFAGDVPPSDVPGEPTPENESSKDDAPLAGSPPVDLGKFSDSGELPPGPEDDDDEEWSEEDDDDDEGEEGDEEDDDEDDDEDDEDEDDEEDEDEDEEPSVTDPKALSSFEARITPASPKRQELPSESTTPATEKKASYTPVGFPKAPVDFAPPSRNNLQGSPRSPSPQRSVTAPLFPKSPSSKPSLPSQIQKIAIPPGKPMERPARASRPAEPEAGDLEDEEDASVKAILSTKPTPTTDLPHFLAHQNYIGHTDKPGLGGQIERVYRDINSMVDTLGLNAHSLQGLVDGHTELRAPGERDLGDLDDEDNWVIDEVADLAHIQDNIDADLDSGKLDNVREKLERLRAADKEAARLQTKMASVRKQISARTGPEETAARLAAPLPVETQAQQSELRQKVQEVQALLGKAEESVSMLRADLASVASSKGSAHVPTVEAVMNTIMKMTAMVEQKSGDIDVLEAQIKRLPNGIASLNLNDDYEDDLVSALRGTELPKSSPHTPAARRTSRRAFNGDALGMSGMFGSRFQTPPQSSKRRSMIMFSPEASAFGSSINGSARKKMMDVTEDEISAYQTKKQSRARVMDALKNRIENSGPRVVEMER